MSFEKNNETSINNCIGIMKNHITTHRMQFQKPTPINKRFLSEMLLITRRQRIPKRFVFFHRSPIHRGNYILSFAFGFDKEDDVFQFALTAPYSYSRLQSYLLYLENKVPKSFDCFERKLLTNSVQKRRLDLITIGPKIESQEKQRVIVITARVHPGESPVSFVCQGLIEILLSSHPIAKLLRENVVFKIVPMLNPDGVYLGNTRSTYMGIDLNRSWHIASQWCHPTIKAVLDMLLDIDKSEQFQLDFVLDLHAHFNLKGCFIYGNTYEDVYRFERHIVFPKILATVCDDYVSSNTMFNADFNKFGSARRFLCSVLSEKVNCYTFEVSAFGYSIKGTEIIPYTEESYMRCGRNLARAFLEYYKATGFIPLHLATEISCKKKNKPRYCQHKSKELVNSFRESSKTPAVLKFMELQLNYDSETSNEDYGLKNVFSPGRNVCQNATLNYPNKHCKQLTSNTVPKFTRDTSPPPHTLTVLPQPNLTIIDFNLITRDIFENVNKK